MHGPEAGEKLIHAFNLALSTEEIFNYHLALIKKTQGQKGVIEYFPSYLKKQWNNKNNKAKLNRDLERTLKNTPPEQIDNAISQTLQTYMRDCVYNALLYMYEEAEVQNGVKGQWRVVERPYKELAEALRRDQDARNEFIDGMIEEYGLDKFVAQLGEDIVKSQNAKSKLYTTVTPSIFNVSAQKGGFAKEIETWFTAIEKGINGQRTGGATVKPDIVFTVDVPGSIVDAAFANIPTFANRAEHVAAAQDIEKHLADFNDGFLIYVNAKNYTLNKDFETHGFRAEEDIALRSWTEILSTLGRKSTSLIFSVLQLIPGAIGDTSENYEQVTTMFARAIAGALFDDFDVEGVVPRTGAKTIHLLNLNGIYIPMSFYYDRLQEAFELGYKKKPVRVRIKTPPSVQFLQVYPEEGGTVDTNESFWRDAHPDESPWHYQQQLALDEIKISFYFLQTFKDMMANIHMYI